MTRQELKRVGMVALVFVAGVVRLGAAANETRVVTAVRDGDVAAVTALLKQHADVNVPLADGTTALHVAAERNLVEMATLLIQAGADVQAANRYGATPLWIAATNGNAAAVSILLRGGAKPNTPALAGEPPLLAAARSGSLEAVKALVESGADVNATETLRGQTALMWAVGDHDPHPDVARVLLEHGADPNVRSKSGFTPLLFAARQGDLASVRLLVDRGARINEKSDASSVLLMAVNNSQFDIGTFLVEKGADPNAPDRTGYTPLHRTVLRRAALRAGRSSGAARNEGSIPLLKALLAHGANPNLKTLKAPPKPVDAEPNPRPQIDELQVSGVTPLWLAASAADVEVMRLLVAAGADAKTLSMDGTTPLMVAAGLGQGFRGGGVRRGRDADQEAAEAVTQLLEWGNDIQAANAHGQTAIHGAADGVSAAALQVLVDHGARLDRKDEIGRTPYRIVDDHKTDKYRSNQDFEPAEIDGAWTLLRKLGGDAATK